MNVVKYISQNEPHLKFLSYWAARKQILSEVPEEQHEFALWFFDGLYYRWTTAITKKLQEEPRNVHVWITMQFVSQGYSVKEGIAFTNVIQDTFFSAFNRLPTPKELYNEYIWRGRYEAAFRSSTNSCTSMPTYDIIVL